MAGHIVKILTTLKKWFYAYYEINYIEFTDNDKVWSEKRINRFVITAEIDKINTILKTLTTNKKCDTIRV